MRIELENTASLRLGTPNGGTIRPSLGRGAQGLPGPGSAAWTALQAVTTGSVRQAPDGSWIKSLGNRTTRASFDATEETFWEAVSASEGTVEQRAQAASIAQAVGDLIVVSNGDADQTDRIQEALDTVADAGATDQVVRRVSLVGEFGISEPIVVGSYTYFDTFRATVTALADGNMIQSAGVPSLRTVVGSMTQGSDIFEAAPGTFTDADLGRTLVVAEAGPLTINAEGPGGGPRYNFLCGNVLERSVDGSEATLSRPAINAVTDADATVHNRSANITLDLGVWNRGTFGGTDLDTSVQTILLRRIDRLRIPRVNPKSQFEEGELTGGGKNAVSYGDITDGLFGEGGAEFQVAGDGFHGIGPLTDIKILNVTSDNHDDGMAFTVSDYAYQADICGPMHNITIDGLTATTEDARGVLVSCNVREAYQITGLTIRNVRGTTNGPFVRLTGSNELDTEDNSGHEGIPYALVEDIQGTPRTVSAMVSLAGNIGVVEGRNWNLLQISGSGGMVETDTNIPTTIRALRINGWSVPDGRTGTVITTTSIAEIGHLLLSDADITLSGSSAWLYYGAGDVKRVTLRNHTQVGGRGMDLRRDTAVCTVDLANVESTVPIIRVSGGSTQLTVFTSGKCYYSGISEGLVRLAGGTGTCTLHAGPGFISASGRAMSRSASQTLRLIGLSGRQNAADLTPNAGDHHFNTSAAVAAGIGPVIYDSVTAAYKTMGTTGTVGVVVPPGSGLSGTPVNEEVLTDTFTRTNTDVVTSLPDAGGSAYTGPATSFLCNGSRLVKGATMSATPVLVQAPAKGDMDLTVTWRTGTTEAGSVTERIYIKTITATDGIRIDRTGQNTATLRLYAVMANTARQIGSNNTTAIPASTAPADYPVNFKAVTVAGVTTVTAIVNGVTIASGDLTAPEAAALADARSIGYGSTSPNTQFDDAHLIVDGEYS